MKRSIVVVILAVVLLNCSSSCANPADSDINKDGSINMLDLSLLAKYWLLTIPDPNEFAYVPAGTFEMGDSFSEGHVEELPVHTVTLDSFYMGKYEITTGQYCAYLNSALGSSIYVSSGIVYGSGNNQPYCDTSISSEYSWIDYDYLRGIFSVRTKPAVGGRDMSNDPMVMVTWYGAVAYCNWRSQQDGYQQCYDCSEPNCPCDFSKHGYRLPTEAEWEYAARGGQHDPYYRFPWGDTISHSQANYYSYWLGGGPVFPYDVSPTEGYHPTWNDGIWPYTSPVGSFSASGYGLYDMAGNVWECCNDWYSTTYYSSGPPNNPTGPSSGMSRVIRGGAWDFWALECRTAYRGSGPAGQGHFSVGFRLAVDLF